MPIIAVVGSIITDLAVLTPRLPARGENILARRLQIGPGGKGANAAVAAARLGARSILVGRVGDDPFGHQELAALRAEGVDTSAVGVDPEAQTGAAVIMVDDEGENTILVIIGANDQLTAEQVEAGLAPHWGRLDALLVNFEVPPAAIAAAVNGAHARGVPTIVDAGPPRQFGPEIWGRATVISPNALEAAMLVGQTHRGQTHRGQTHRGRPVEDTATAEAAARELLAGGPQAVVLKRGAAGALLVTREGAQHVPSFRVKVVDTTGAGDAFSAALVVAMAEGKPLPEAVRFANAAGALAVTRVGTLRAMPTRAEVDAFLA
jgi:ribokinase